MVARLGGDEFGVIQCQLDKPEAASALAAQIIQAIKEPYEIDGMVQTAPDGTVYAFIVGSGLMKSPGASLDWGPLNNEFGEGVLLHLAVDPADPKRMFAVTEQSEVLTSTDGGTTWRPLS